LTEISDDSDIFEPEETANHVPFTRSQKNALSTSIDDAGPLTLDVLNDTVAEFVQEPTEDTIGSTTSDIIAVNDRDQLYEYSSIVDHKKYEHGWYNFLLQWKDGSQSWTHYKTLRAYDPIALAHYCQKKNLSTKYGLKWTKSVLRLQIPMAQISSQKIKYGLVIPKTFYQARDLDKERGTTFWQDATTKEVTC